MEMGTAFVDLVSSVLVHDYEEQQLEANLPEGYDFRLFHLRYSFTPKWKFFIEPIVKSNQNILATKSSAQQNYVLLIKVNNTKNIYAVTGGYGHNAIREFTSADFGLDVLSRFIKKEDKILKSAKERNFVGGIMGSTKYFRNNFNLFENEGFGKFYQELQATLEKEFMVNSLGFSEEDLKKGAVCSARSSFKINKAIDFSKLLNVIAACEDILKKDPIISINDVKKLTKQKNGELIENLNDALFDQLWSVFQSLDSSYPFDLCHSDFERYLTARSYRVKMHRQRKIPGTDTSSRMLVNYFDEYEFDSLVNIKELFVKIKTDITIKNQKHFSGQISSLKIVSYDEDGNELTSGDLLSHLMGDVSHDGEKFFYVDKAWYQIKASFIDDLNASCKIFVQKSSYQGSMKPWDVVTQKENDYNAGYIGDEGTIVLDKIIPENIELCDILRWDDDNIFLIHVKAGFGNTMRDLCAQIAISANRLVQDLQAVPSKAFVRKVYQALRAKKGTAGYFGDAGDQTDNITEEDFVALFEKRIHFVLAVLDTGTAERDLQNIEKFNSSIAKFSLHALTTEMTGAGQSLQIYQIKKGKSVQDQAA